MSKTKVIGSLIFLVCFLTFTAIGVGLYPHWSKATQSAAQLHDLPNGDNVKETIDPSKINAAKASNTSNPPVQEDSAQSVPSHYPEESAFVQSEESLPSLEAEQTLPESKSAISEQEEAKAEKTALTESTSNIIMSNTKNGELAPVPLPGPPGTPIHPYYDEFGNPPTAPGLAMRKRRFEPENGKIAYLTFDDGPYPSTTPKILAALKKENVRATFFDIGKQVELYPDLLKAEFEQNHVIGNHTYSHNLAEVYKSPQYFLADVKKAEEIIYQTIGIRPQIVRAPGGTVGHFSIDYFNAVDAEGYMMMDWNIDPGDTKAHLQTKDQLISQVEEQIQGKNRVIILLHDLVGKDTTIEALPEIIKMLKERGYSFGVLGPHVMPIIFPAGLMK